MISQALTPIVYAAVVLCWLSAATLVRIARQEASIVALSERAFVAVLLSVFMSLFAFALLNVDLGYPFLTTEGGRILVRLAALTVVAIPLRWAYLYRRGWRK